jgi:hypothetical protein
MPDALLEVLRVGIGALESLTNRDRRSVALLAALLNCEGCLLYKAGRIKDAENDLVECARLDPDNQTYRKNLELVRREAARNARPRPNDLCPCGSGRRFRKCCGLRR